MKKPTEEKMEKLIGNFGILKNLPQIKVSQDFCDLKIKASNSNVIQKDSKNQTKIISFVKKSKIEIIPVEQKCHRLVLAAAGNEFLKTILRSTVQDLDYQGDEDFLTILMPDFSKKELDLFLRFIYGQDEKIDLSLPICQLLLLKSKQEPNDHDSDLGDPGHDMFNNDDDYEVKIEVNKEPIIAINNLKTIPVTKKQQEKKTKLKRSPAKKRKKSESENEDLEEKSMKMDDEKIENNSTCTGTTKKKRQNRIRQEHDQFLAMAAEQLNTTTTELVKDDSNKWSCLDCLEVKSVSFQKLIEHMESAHSKKPSGRFCERCGTKFESKEELIIHNINEQCVRQLSTNNKCVKCSITFHSFRNLQAHVFLQHCQGNLPIKWCLYYCEICNKMFHNVDKFRLHQQVIHEVNLTNFTDRIVYKLKEALQYEEDAEDTANYVAKTLYTFCKLCCQKFTKRLDFRDHFKTQHVDLFETRKNSGKVREMFDDTIGFTYSPQEDIVPDTKIYVTCLVCNRTFTGRSGFQKHVKDHHQSDEVFLCRRCKVPFPTKYVMVEHRRTCLRTIPCDLCSLKFFSSATLKNHIALRHATADKPKSKVHEKVKQPDGSVKYKCDICDKCFGSNKSVYLHKDALHNTANPDETFPCSYEGCSYVARLSHNLTTHVGTQHCEKNHVCDQCGASFRGGNILKLHTIKHHTTDEKHGCDVCSKVFNNPITLKRHKVGSHADARYVCITCGKVFIRYSSFRFHQLHTHNEKRDFICPRCKKGFKIRPHLRRHMNKCCNGWTEHVLS